MTNEEILEKAIQKSASVGFALPGLKMYPNDTYEVSEVSQDGYFVLQIDGSYDQLHVNQLIFNHDFARALWGEESPTHDLEVTVTMKDKTGKFMGVACPQLAYWEYKLQQMVIATDPIKYLKDNLNAT